MKYCRKCDMLTYQGICMHCYGKVEEISEEEEREILKRHIEERKISESNSSSYRSYTPKCPVCQSPNISKISTANRAAHGIAFGLFSKTARSQWVCSNCGHKF